MDERYKIISPIGEGAFSTVFLGKHRTKREKVAIKIEPKNSPTEGIALLHECKIILYLANGNSYTSCNGVPTVRYFENGPENVFMVMDYYENNLAELVKQKKLSILDKYQIFREVFIILNSIHGKYVVHRDIKPTNIMLRPRETPAYNTPKYEVCLVDFGMAKVFIDENGEHIPNKKITELIGTPKYVSLFVHSRNEPAQRDDFISLGYVFLYMLNDGSLPWSDGFDESKKSENIISAKKKEWLEEVAAAASQPPPPPPPPEKEILITYLTNCYKMGFTDTYNHSFPSAPANLWRTSIIAEAAKKPRATSAAADDSDTD